MMMTIIPTIQAPHPGRNTGMMAMAFEGVGTGEAGKTGKTGVFVDYDSGGSA